MKIALIAESYPPAVGGVEFALQSLVQGFMQKGHEVWVVTSSWQRHAAGEEKSGTLKISRLKTLRFFHRFWFILFSIPLVIRAARWADIVQGSTFAGGLPAFLGAWFAGKKKVLLVHEVWGKRWPEFEPTFMRRMFYRSTEWIIVRLPFDHYVAVSQYTGRCLQAMGVAEQKISTVYHGDSRFGLPETPREEVRKELGLGAGDFVFLTFGRVGISKGYEFLAEAIPELVSRLANARFVLVLSGYDPRIASRIARKLATVSPDRYKLVQSLPRAQLARYVHAADAVVIPSLSEGFGFSALEACNAGKIVVSTDGGALPEVVFGKHVFVKPGSVRSLVEGCMKAYQGGIGFSPRKEFSWDKAVSAYLRLYEEILGHGSSVGGNV